MGGILLLDSGSNVSGVLPLLDGSFAAKVAVL